MMNRVERLFSMSDYDGMMERAESLSRKWGWFLAFGIALIICGLVALSHAVTATFVSVFFLGSIMMIAGVIHLVEAFTAGKWNMFFVHTLVSLLYIVFGFVIFRQPTAAAVGVTLLMAAFFFVSGIFRIVSALSVQMPQWGWLVFSGVVSVILGILVTAAWPSASLWVLGVYVGVDLIVTGWTLVVASMVVRDVGRDTHGAIGQAA